MTSSEPDPELRRRIHQQEVVAEFGQQALNTDDLDQLLHDAAVVVTETLDANYVRVIEFLPGNNEAFLRQGIGWPDSHIGATVPTSQDSLPGHTLHTENPIIVDDFRTDDRFSNATFLTPHDISSSISVIIGTMPHPWGVLEIHATEEQAFIQHDTTFVQNIANILATTIRNTETQPEFEKIYGRVSDAVFALNDDWEFTYLNDRAHDLINPLSHDLIGQNIWEEFPAGDVQKFKQKYEQAMSTQETVSFEEYYPDPLNCWFEVRAFPSETGLSVYFQDISERKERERQHELFRVLLDYSNDSVLVIDPQTAEFLDVNETACRRLGYDRDELLDLTVLDIEQRFTDIEDWRSHVDDVQAEGAITIEGKHQRQDGTTYPAEVNVAHVDLDRSYMIGIARDITDRLKYERELKDSNERLEQFAYAASHDLQEPLRMIINYLQLLENRYNDELDEDGQEFINFAVDGAERMRNMIDGLLEYSRVETGGDPFEPVDLVTVLDDVLNNLQVAIEETNAEVTADSLPRVQGDKSQLQQVFQNLVSNAIEYSGDKPPQIHITATKNGQYWTISVCDNGIGIDPAVTDEIFQIFQRLHSREEYEGTGIGLALCQRIIERHNGDIWVDSEPGDGATFSFTLPSVQHNDP